MGAVTKATAVGDAASGPPQPDPADSALTTRHEPRFADRTTAAIRIAFFDELAAVGYSRLSVDSIVKRAAVSKAAVYRRWRNKTDMAHGLISEIATSTIDLPDLGSLRADLLAFLTATHDAVRHPAAARIIPSLLSEAIRDDGLAAILRETVEGPRRDDALRLLQRAVDRAELPVDCDLDLCLDHMIGALYFHALVRQRDFDRPALQRLADSLVAAMTATRRDHPGT